MRLPPTTFFLCAFSLVAATAFPGWSENFPGTFSYTSFGGSGGSIESTSARNDGITRASINSIDGIDSSFYSGFGLNRDPFFVGDSRLIGSALSNKDGTIVLVADLASFLALVSALVLTLARTLATTSTTIRSSMEAIVLHNLYQPRSAGPFALAANLALVH